MSETLQEVVERLTRIESVLESLVNGRACKEWFSTKEVADILGKAEFTVREWCRLGRVHAKKQNTGRGPHAAWVISRQEVLRIEREGLLPA
jgi:DNA-directed RNA polymerase specialized sigma24 family protein